MSEYGLDYAMGRHDIERLEEVPLGIANEKMAIGWKSLHIGNIHTSGFPFDGDHNSEFYIVMGVPRPKECNRWKEPHEDIVKIYNLRDDKWECPKCLAHPLEDGEDGPHTYQWGIGTPP